MNHRFAAMVFMAAALLTAACASPGPTMEEMREIRGNIAGAYNAGDFDRVESIQFTFNVQLPQTRVARTWTWWPAENRVVFFDGSRVTEYDRDVAVGLLPEEIQKIDAGFINDQYWLLFPYHVVWDTMAAVQVMDDRANLPMGDGWAQWVRVSYPPEGGYTPGDTYDLYLGPNHRIIQWVYHKGGAEEATRMSTWESYRRFGPIILSLDHRGPADSNFRVWFTDVIVTTDDGLQYRAGY